MYAQTQYGQIIQDVVVAHAVNTDVDHVMDTDNFCVFGIQDITAGTGTAQEAQRVYAPSANRTARRAGDPASQFRVTDPAAGEVPRTFDFWLAAAQSRFDVGPIVTGATRNATDQFRPSAGRVPAYRSLHRNVPFTTAIGGITVDVNVTHRLGTPYALAFVFPTVDPYDVGRAKVLRVWQSANPDANTVTLRMACEGGDSFTAVQTVTWDVIVVSVTNVGHNSFLCPVGTGGEAGQIDPTGGDYDHGDRVIRPRRPGYASLYYDVGSIGNVGGAGSLLLHHNMNAYAQIALVGLTANVNYMTPYIYTRYGIDGAAGPNRVIELAQVGTPGATMDNNLVLVARTYSPIVIGEDNIPPPK